MNPSPAPHQLTAPRLQVGIISAGKVGTTLAAALAQVGHRVSHVVAPSEQSRARAKLRIPQAALSTPQETAANCELLVIAVPDREIAPLASQLAPYLGPGKIVLHTAGSLGRAVLDPVALTGALTIAAHPAMTFAGIDADVDNLHGCPWGVTVGDELSRTVAELLVAELGGRPVFIDERQRGLYHAAMAHGSNGLGAVVVDAVELLAEAIGGDDYSDDQRRREAATLLSALLHASLDNTLKWGARALTGPVTRDDVSTVATHEQVIGQRNGEMVAAYRQLALRIAEMRGATGVLRHLEPYRQREDRPGAP